MNPPRKTAAAKSWPNLWGPRKAKLLGKGGAAERVSVQDAARENSEACDDAIPM